jgi:predicted dehydrogenase
MHHSSEDSSRRGFLREFGAGALGAMAFAAGQSSSAAVAGAPEAAQPASDRKVRMAIVGHGVCGFGASLGFQHHPNVQIVAVSDLVPERRSALARICGCEKTYDSLESLVKDPAIEAVCLATDAPSHARHAIEVLKHGKHCVTAVPAAVTLDDCQAVKEAKEKSGLKYMMAETSYYHGEVIRSRNLYRLGEKLLYTEGHYYHHGVTRLGSWKNWRRALPPMYYPTHSTAYYVGVSGKRLTQVSCLGFRGPGDEWEKNAWDNNPFVNESALFHTSEGTMCRINVFWWGASASGESGSWIWEKQPTAKVPNSVPLPKSVPAGGHGGSHGPLAHEFVTALLENREPAIDVYEALAMVAPGIVAHQSALKGGAQLPIPSFDK